MNLHSFNDVDRKLYDRYDINHISVHDTTAQCADFILTVKCSQLDQDLSQYAERGVYPDERKVSCFKWICVERLDRKLCFLEHYKPQRD